MHSTHRFARRLFTATGFLIASALGAMTLHSAQPTHADGGEANTGQAVSLGAPRLAGGSALVASSRKGSTVGAENDGKAVLAIAESSSPDNPRFLVSRGGALRFAEIVELYAEARGVPVVTDARYGSYAASVPSASKAVDVDALGMVQTVLAAKGMVLVEQEGVARITSMQASFSLAPALTSRQALEAAPDWQLVCFAHRLKQLSANAVRQTLATLATRGGGMVLPLDMTRYNPAQRDTSGGESLVICDFAYNVRNMLALLDQVDQSPAAHVSSVELDVSDDEAEALTDHLEKLYGLKASWDAATKRLLAIAGGMDEAELRLLVESVLHVISKE